MGEIFQSAVLIFNPVAGRLRRHTEKKIAAIRAALEALGLAMDARATTNPGSATALARQAAERGAELVLVCGGDGTINEAVNGLAGSQAALGVLPAGTANVLAKELELPWDPARAAQIVVQGRRRRIALGLAAFGDALQQKRYFICMGGAGADGIMVYSVPPQRKHLGILAYWMEGARQIVKYPFPPFRVISAERSETATLVVAGRTQHYGGPVKITDQADLFEDSFEILACTARSRWTYMAGFFPLLLGRHRRRKENVFWKTQSLRCEPLDGRKVYAQVDGEPIGALPVAFSIVPDALTLLVPGGAPRQESGSWNR
jgi:YegS/Rv2252/BmrU family lipid kinase